MGDTTGNIRTESKGSGSNKSTEKNTAGVSHRFVVTNNTNEISQNTALRPYKHQRTASQQKKKVSFLDSSAYLNDTDFGLGSNVLYVVEEEKQEHDGGTEDQDESLFDDENQSFVNLKGFGLKPNSRA